MKTLFFVSALLAATPAVAQGASSVVINACGPNAPGCNTIVATICDAATPPKCFEALTLKGRLCGPATIRITKDDPPALDIAEGKCVPDDPQYVAPEKAPPGRWRVQTRVGPMDGGWFILELNRGSMLCGHAVVTTPTSVAHLKPEDCIRLGHKQK